MKILFLTLGFCYSALAFKLDCHDWQAERYFLFWINPPD